MRARLFQPSLPGPFSYRSAPSHGSLPLVSFASRSNSGQDRHDLDLNVDAATSRVPRSALAGLATCRWPTRVVWRGGRTSESWNSGGTQESEVSLSTLVKRGRLRANIPSSPSRALHSIVHDLFKRRRLIGAGELASGAFMVSRSWRKATSDWTSLRRPCRTRAAATPLMLSFFPCTISLVRQPRCDFPAPYGSIPH